MSEDERNRILAMLSEGKITVDEAERLLDALGAKQPAEENIQIKDNRGRRPKKLRVIVDASGNDGSNQNAKVNVNIPISLIRSVGPVVLKSMPTEAKNELDKKGVNLEQIFEDIEKMLDEGLEEDIVNIDAGEDGKNARVRVYVE